MIEGNCENCGHEWKWHFVAGCIEMDEIHGEECGCLEFVKEGGEE